MLNMEMGHFLIFVAILRDLFQNENLKKGILYTFSLLLTLKISSSNQITGIQNWRQTVRVIIRKETSQKLCPVQLVEPGYTEATSSSTYLDRHPASFSVDGNFNQQLALCSHTDDKDEEEAWLRIDLRKIFSINSVRFWYRNDRGFTRSTIRLRGYSIRVSNDSMLPSQESSCYTDPGNVTLPTVIEEDCERTARYVWFYQNNTAAGGDMCPMLEICEVQVFACVAGAYGQNCSENCDTCLEQKCHHVSGVCEIGCKDGYRTTQCKTACESGTYGLNCSETCGHCSGNLSCNHVNGNCTNGCDDGYETEPLCKTACESGTYGLHCRETCGHCSGNLSCNHVNGVCTNGCDVGYETEPLCKTVSEPDTSSSSILDNPLSVPLCLTASLLCVSISIIFILLVKYVKKRRPEMSSLQENRITNIYENIDLNTTHERNVVGEDYAEIAETNPEFK